MSFCVMNPCGSAFITDTMKIMQEKHNWHFVYSIVAKDNYRQIERLKNINPDMILHDSHDAICGIPPSGSDLEQYSQALDKEILSKFCYCETICLKMMDRMASIDAFAYSERVRLFHKQLSFWIGALNKIKPNLVLFSVTPHMIFDYVIYEVCKYLGLNTFILAKTPIVNLIYGMQRFEDGFLELKKAYTEAQETDIQTLSLWPESEKYLNNLCEDYSSGKPEYMKYLEKEMQNTKFGILNSVRLLRNALFKEVPRNYQLLHGQRPKYYYRKTKLKYGFNRLKTIWRRRNIKKYYEKLTSNIDIDLSVPFVFMALQCQPEMSTSPLGDIFVHQYLAVELLSSCLPEGWVIYIKEHVSQFSGIKHVDKSKSFGFYDDLVAIKNVRLLPLTFTSFDLIDKAKAVAAITGTVGFEAINRGKPVLIFGQNWYNGCEGVFETPTADTCRKALMQIQNGITIDHDKIRLFVTLIQKLGIKGYNTEIYKAKGAVSAEEMTCSLVKALKQVMECSYRTGYDFIESDPAESSDQTSIR
jgi:hypothetical protein